MSVLGECRSCHRPVIWVITENDRSMPLDAEPVDDGNVLLTGETNRFGAPIVRVLGQPSLIDPPGDRYVSHFVTCPNADDWRKR